MRLRSSSQRLNCKTARYITESDLNKHQRTSLWTKICLFCTKQKTLTLTHQPFGNIMKEEEHHVQISCPKFHEHQTALQAEAKSQLLRNEAHQELYEWNKVKNFARFARYVKKIVAACSPKSAKKDSGSSNLRE